jgi:hypothetical protein
VSLQRKVCFATRATAAMMLAGLAFASQTPHVSAPAPNAPPFRMWRSETTGNVYRVRVEGDTLFAEWVNIPPDLARRGAYVRTECRRLGSEWIGTTRSQLSLPCTEVSGPHGHPTSWCSLVTRTEINTVSSDRITGRAQAPHRLDCRSCKLIEADWKNFVWVPVR